MKILITGADGQLGSELREILGHREGVTTFFLGRKELPLDQTFIIQDILGMYEPDVILHCGAYTAVDRAESEPELADAVNHLASEEIAIYCRLHGAKLMYISTDYVFDGESDIALSEVADVSPVNRYGLTKLKGEQVIQKWLPEAIIIRTSWVYSTYGNNFVKTMLRLMDEREEISVINDQIGSPTYAKDLAFTIVKIVEHSEWIPGVYHYSNEGQLSWHDFAVAIRDIRELDCTIRSISTSEYPTAAKRPRFSLLDKSKIKETFGVNVPYWRESLINMLSSDLDKNRI